MRYGKIDEMDACKISNKKSAFKNTAFKLSNAPLYILDN